jgi:Phosphate propanoyltransferase
MASAVVCTAWAADKFFIGGFFFSVAAFNYAFAVRRDLRLTAHPYGPADAGVLGLKNHAKVAAVMTAGDRRRIFGDVVARVSPAFRIELHLDSDEGNATGLQSGSEVMLTEIRLAQPSRETLHRWL